MKRAIDTKIYLPPGLLPREAVREILRLTLEEFRWFVPVRYGALESLVLPGEIGVDGMLAFYKQRRYLMVGARTDSDFIAILYFSISFDRCAVASEAE